MSRHQNKSAKKPRSEKKIQASKIAVDLHFAGARRDDAFLYLKRRATVEDLAFFARHAFSNRNVFSTFHGNPFPKKISEFFAIQPYGSGYSTQDEIKWSLFRAYFYIEELNEFVKLKERFELAVLLQDKNESSKALDEVESLFGMSFWLLQNRFTHAQVWDGLDAKRTIANIFIDEAKDNVLARILTSFISRRSEATGLKNYLQEELSKMLGGMTNSLIENYLRTKLFDLGQMSVSNISVTLLFDAQVSLIDQYETLILILQSVVVDKTLPLSISENILKQIGMNERLCDTRLKSIARSLSRDFIPKEDDINSLRAEIVEKYSSGEYDEMLKLSTDYLQKNVQDISICALRAKTIIIKGEESAPLPGLLNEISRMFVKIMELGKDSYGAAFALYTMHDRYYGQHWAIMARAVMNDVLTQVSLDFPRPTFQYLMALDANISPFTTFSLSLQAREDFRNSVQIKNSFPITSNVLSTLLNGASDFDQMDLRLRTYQAHHFLISENYSKAATEFKELTELGHKVSRFFAAAYATLAYLKLDNISAAVDLVVKGTLVSRDVPIVMPIPEVIARLDEPTTWPNHITLPILFEFHTAFFEDDKISHLRVAFEKYQLANNIHEPEQLAEKISEFGLQTIVAYLDKVWRPEVMRQTLLYSTPREIEDARIAVCRVLATIDPQNSNRYQEEIRDRVKRQEIAKGTTLLEQSKVYVDIVAIKKSLNTKLGDTYARYKAALEAKPSQPDTLVENLADFLSEKMPDRNSSITNALSKIHLFNYRETEVDLQFSALFSEVTNEFLRGDHGLNAYLSTRVRHGTLANTLRKPLADEYLVTALKEDESGYLPNAYWDNSISVLSIEEQENIKSALEQFTRAFDAIVEYVKNKIIQIRSQALISGVNDDSEAMFLYPTSNLERRFIQAYDRNVTNIEQFIDRCIEALWEKTDANLESVRKKIRQQVRSQFLDCFDKLSETISTVSNAAAVSNLSNAIARARTDFQTKMHLVESWFNRQAVYDRQDYAPEYAVHIAQNMVQKTLPNKYQKLNVDLISEGNSAMMPGRTLDSMVDVFASLLDNATIRSGLPIEQLKVKITVSFERSKFTSVIENNVSSDKPSIADSNKISIVRESLNKTESRIRAQSEKGSGLLKIWRALQSPVYKDPFFSFNYDKSVGFKVVISCNIERSNDEISIN